MFWKFGWFLKTLNYLIETEISRTIYQNKTYKKHKWNLIERIIISCTKRPLLSVSFLLLLFFLFSTSLCLSFQNISVLIPSWKQPWSFIIKWQENILISQLMLIGLIVPIVIGFIGLLLQNRSANRALWTIYNSYSGVLYIGLSGITLCLSIYTLKLFHPWFSHRFDISVTIAFVLWIIYNLCLSAWFLWATFKFISLEDRSELVLRFTINETLINELRSKLTRHLPINILKENFNINRKATDPIIEFYYDENEREKKCIRWFSSEKTVINIRFRFLISAVKNWRRKAKKQSDTTAYTLYLPLGINQGYSKKQIIAASDSDTLSWYIQKLLKLSYSFGNMKTESKRLTNEIISALFGNVDDSLKEKNIKLFKDSIDEIKNWHIEITNAMAFKNEKNEKYNWLLLFYSGVIPKTIIDILIHEYQGITVTTIREIPNSTEYFESMCYIYNHLYYSTIKDIPYDVAAKYILGHYSTWRLLINWQSSIFKEIKTADPSLIIIKPIKHFIGSWEFWKHEINIDKLNFSTGNSNLKLSLIHLECTSRFIIYAIRHENWFACEWATDMLVHWLENMLFYRDIQNSKNYFWKTETLTPCVITQPSNTEYWKLILNDEELNDANQQVAIQIALKNAWVDVRLLVAFYIMAKPKYFISDNLNKITDALIYNKRLRHSLSFRPSYAHIKNGADITSAYLRHRWRWEFGEYSHSSWLDELLAYFNEMEEPEPVPGRIYDSWGRHSVFELLKYYQIASIRLSSKEWELSQSWYYFLFSNMVSHEQRERIIEDLEQLKVFDKDLIKSALTDIEESDKISMIDNYKKSLDKIISKLKEEQVKEVTLAGIDDERVAEFAKAVSSTAFTKSNVIVPISLFKDINYSNDITSKCIYKADINGYPRKEVSKGVEVDRPSIESDILSEIISKNISNTLFEQIFSLKDKTSSEHKNKHSLIEKVIRDSESLIKENYTPILFIGPLDIFELLRNEINLSFSNQKEQSYDVTRQYGYPESYVCHLNKIQVYNTPFIELSFCFLIAKETLESVNFKKYGEDIFVKPDFIPNDEDPLYGTLSFTYGAVCNLKKIQSFKYIYIDEN